MNNILLVEDDRSLGATMQERLQKESHKVVWVQNFHDAEKACDETSFDLFVLDVGLPDGSGFDFAKKVKQFSSAPFLFVTAQSSANDRLHGFEIGAEEFIPKPFHLKEFILRVQHVLEKHVGESVLKVDGREIHFGSMLVIDDSGAETFLAAKDFQILRFLIDCSPRAVSRDEILNHAWGEEKFPSNRTVDNAIVRLRQALNDQSGSIIRSIRSVGYQFLGEKNGK